MQDISLPAAYPAIIFVNKADIVYVLNGIGIERGPLLSFCA
jgi:hypothetical protein